MKWSERQVGDAVVATVAGRIDLTNADALRDQMTEALKKTKAALVLAEHETLEAALAAGRFAAEADDLRLYRRIATMRTDAPVPELPDTTPDWARAAGLAATWGLQALERRLRARFDGSED